MDERMEAVEEREQRILGQALGMIEDVCDEDVSDEMDTDLFEAGLLDSMAAIELLVEIEETFGVDIAPTEVERDEMNTPRKIVRQIALRLPA